MSVYVVDGIEERKDPELMGKYSELACFLGEIDIGERFVAFDFQKGQIRPFVGADELGIIFLAVTVDHGELGPVFDHVMVGDDDRL